MIVTTPRPRSASALIWLLLVIIGCGGATARDASSDLADTTIGPPGDTAADLIDVPSDLAADCGDRAHLDATSCVCNTGFVATPSGACYPEVNPAWIGGACGDEFDCSRVADSSRQCLTHAWGFPAGMCTQGCSSSCPDEGGPNDLTTFCITTSARATSRCWERWRSAATPPGRTTASRSPFAAPTTTAWA